jgi:hypothetical protein
MDAARSVSTPPISPHLLLSLYSDNILLRNSFSVVSTIVAGPLIVVIGNGWLFTILGLLTLASASVV